MILSYHYSQVFEAKREFDNGDYSTAQNQRPLEENRKHGN